MRTASWWSDAEELALRLDRYVAGNTHALASVRVPSPEEKKAIVAIARQLAVDLWRWRTGRVKPETLGWQMLEVKPA